MAGGLLFFNTLKAKELTIILGSLLFFEQHKLARLVARLCPSGTFILWSSVSPLEQHQINTSNNIYHEPGARVTSIV